MTNLENRIPIQDQAAKIEPTLEAVNEVGSWQDIPSDLPDSTSGTPVTGIGDPYEHGTGIIHIGLTEVVDLPSEFRHTKQTFELKPDGEFGAHPTTLSDVDQLPTMQKHAMQKHIPEKLPTVYKKSSFRILPQIRKNTLRKK